MKRALRAFLALLPLLTAVLPAEAQERTLVKGDIESGGFGAAVAKVTEIQGDVAAIAGLRGGWVIDHVFVLGAGFYGLASDVSTGSAGVRDIEFGYGGIELEYIGEWREVLHWTIYGLVGGGGIEHAGRTDGVFVFEPAFTLEANVTRFFHLGLGGGYRVVAGVTGPELSSTGMSGVFGALTLKFGSF